MVSDIDKEANTLEDSVGYAENFNKTKAKTGISRKVGHSNSCLDFHFFWKSDLKVSISIKYYRDEHWERRHTS